MRSPLAPIVWTMALVCVGACTTTDESASAYTTISLQPPYSHLPAAPAGNGIEAGTKVTLDAHQQEAVVSGVTKWLKEPKSALFGAIAAARNSRGTITVCGHVNGRNGGGAYVGMAPYVGVMMGTRTSPDFVVVGIGANPRERAEVASICRESGVAELN